MKINKCNKLECMLYDKKLCCPHKKLKKKALEHGLKLKKVQKAIAFSQEAWLKPYIDMNTELRKKAKNDFEKDLQTNAND